MRRSILIIALSCLMLSIAAAPALAVQARNIAVSRVTSSSATLVVKADVTADVSVEYGTAPGTYSATVNGTGQARHELPLSGLAPSAPVYYQVTITESANPASSITLPENSFRTSRVPGEPFSYAVAGDNRPATNTTVQPAAWGTIMGLMINEDIDLLLDVGDIIYGVGSDSLAQNKAKYDGYFAVTAPFTGSAPLYQAIGNHEYVSYANSRQGYEEEFTLPVNSGADAATYGEHYYSFDNGDTHFVALSTEIPGQQGMITGNQMSWMIEDLAATGREWIVVFLHRPLFSGAHTNDPWVNVANTAGQQNRDQLHALFLQYGVDVVFEGHDHFYLRHEEDGIEYIITGGGGAPLSATPSLGSGDVFGASANHYVKVDETPETLTITAIDAAGATLETFSIGSPSLTLSHVRTYWADYDDYLGRLLSVDYSIGNAGPAAATNLQIQYLLATNGVTPTGTPPVQTDLAAGDAAPFTVEYAVPAGVGVFKATTYVVCNDLRGAEYSYPGPAPGF